MTNKQTRKDKIRIKEEIKTLRDKFNVLKTCSDEFIIIVALEHYNKYLGVKQ